MTTLTDQLRLRPTGHSYPVFDRLGAVLAEDLHEIAGTFHTGQEYELHVTVGARFRAIDRHLDDAVRLAKQRILAEIYGPVLEGLERVRAALYAGSVEEATAALDAIQEEIGL